MEQLKIEYLPIADLKPYENNPRKNDDAVRYVANSIKQFGFKVPIIITKDREIVAGHTRLKAAKRIKMTTVPCIVADDLTEDQIKAFRLADNKVSEFAEWDFDALADELSGIGEIDMTLFGFAPAESVVVEDDYNPEIPEDPKSKRGDIYLLGRHRLMCGDSTMIDDVSALVDGNQMDLLLTDPPYNVDYEGTAGKIQNDHMEASAFRRFLADAIGCAVSVMKPGAAFYIWHASSKAGQFFEACDDCGLEIRQVLIWIKDRLVLGRQDFQWVHEPCLYGEVPAPEPDETADLDASLYGWTKGTHHWYRNRKQKTVLEFDRPSASKEHPTMKPVLLFDYQIKCNTKEGENVLDLFGGSGTTVIAAEQDGRNAFIMELDPRFVDVIINRWETFTGEKAVLLNDEG